MKFCPKCEVKLRKDIEGLRCPRCDYAEQSASVVTVPAPDAAPQDQVVDGGNDSLNVFESADDADAKMHPTIKIECEKCKNDEAIWWMLQTRSADEPTTQFYRCTKCQYTWRDYS